MKKPPLIARWILSRINRRNYRDNILGDFEELFNEIHNESGLFPAYVWYLKHILKSLPNFVNTSIRRSMAMIKNYMKIAFRNLKRHKSFSFINIMGLAIGLTCCLLIMLYIQYELSFDKYHKNANEIYRIVMYHSGNRLRGTEWKNSVPGALQASVPEEFSEIMMATRVKKWERIIKQDGNLFTESDFRYVNPEFLDIFSFPLIAGDPKTALIEPFSLLITEDMVKKYFGKENPLNKVLNVDGRDYKITGVLKNIPKNSHFTFDFAASFCTIRALVNSPKWLDGWGGASTWEVYILTKQNIDIKELDSKLTDLLKRNTDTDNENKLRLQPLTSIHLHSKVNFDAPNISDIKYIYLLSVIAVLILLTACFNYMNLSTARSIKRAREVGIRKVVGACRNNLIGQFFGESTLFVIFALIISLIFTYLLIPGFSSFVDLDLNIKMLISGWIITGILGISLFAGLVSGSYPALLLSSFNPVNILKGSFISKSGKSSNFRNILIVFQFTISVVLIICALTTYRQMEFIRTSNLGFQKEHIIYSYAPKTLVKNFHPFKKELENNPDISEIYGIGSIPTYLPNNSYAVWEGKQEDERLYFSLSYVGYDFLDFFNIELLSGRNFSKDFSTDIDKAWIINETAANAIGWEDPIGKKFGFDGKNPSGTIIGVVKDFHFNSFHHKVEPIAVHVGNTFTPSNYFAFKISPENISRSLEFIKEKYKVFSPDSPFIYTFLDETVHQRYQSEQKLSEIFNIFTLIAIFICCIGLFGLVSYTAEQKTKEIGIRKVLGASVKQIIYILSRDFVLWVVLSSVIAFPIAYYSMNEWLNNFAYRVNIGLIPFLLAAALVLMIALFTISFQSAKTALINPVDSLKYE